MGQIISTDWKEENICDICNVYQPKTISSDALLPNGKYTVFGANGIIGKYNDYNHEKPEILVTCRGATCGSINKSLPFSWINGNAMVVSPKNEEILSKSYLYYFLIATNFSRFITGTAQPQITRAGLSPLKIVYPSLSEQQRIVEKLDALFADIEKEKQIAQKNLQNAKELFESGIQKLCLNSCGDNVVKVGDILSLEYGKALERQQRSETGKYLVYGANGPIGRTDQYLCEGKTIIVGRKGSVGEIVVALENNWPVDVTYWVKFDSNLYDFDFLYYLLRGLKLQSMAKGVKPGLNRNDVYALKVHVPQSINEQRNIAQKLNKLHEQSQELERIYTKQIADLDELKQAILKKAFNGEL